MNLRFDAGQIQLARRLTCTSRNTILVLMAAGKQWKAWKQANPTGDPTVGFPGFDLDQISSDSKPWMTRTSPLRVRGKSSEVLQHLVRLNDPQLVSLRHAGSTPDHPKFVLTRKGEALYDAIVQYGYEPFLLSPETENVWYNFVILAVHRMLGNLWMRPDEFDTHCCLHASMVSKGWRELSEGFKAKDIDGNEREFKVEFQTRTEDRSCRLDPKETLQTDPNANADFSDFHPVPVSDLPERISTRPLTNTEIEDLRVKADQALQDPDYSSITDYPTPSSLDALTKALIEDNDSEIPDEALPTDQAGTALFYLTRAQQELLAWQAVHEGVMPQTILNFHFEKLFSEIAGRRKEVEHKAELAAIEAEEAAIKARLEEARRIQEEVEARINEIKAKLQKLGL